VLSWPLAIRCRLKFATRLWLAFGHGAAARRRSEDAGIGNGDVLTSYLCEVLVIGVGYVQLRTHWEYQQLAMDACCTCSACLAVYGRPLVQATEERLRLSLWVHHAHVCSVGKNYIDYYSRLGEEGKIIMAERLENVANGISCLLFRDCDEAILADDRLPEEEVTIFIPE